MAATIHLFAPETCLASELIHELSQWDADDLAETLLLVPTQRLGTALLAGILRQHAALRAPKIMTFENFIRMSSADPNLRVIPESGIELLLRQQLETGDYRQLRAGHERELRLLHNEMIEQACRETALLELQRVLREDIYKSENHLGSLHERALEIQCIFTRLETDLAARNLSTRCMQMARAASRLAKTWPEALPPGLRRIVFAAYTSMAPSWRPALARLLADARSSVWLHEAPKLYHANCPLQELIEWIRSMHGPIVLRTPRVAGLTPKPSLAFKALTPREEVHWALGLSQQWIAEGISPHRIALLVAKESSYAAMLTQEARAMDIPFNSALAQSFASVLAGRLLSLISGLWRQEESTGSLLALLDHPLLQASLLDRFGLQKSSPDPLARLREAVLKAAVPGGLDSIIKTLDSEHAAVLHYLQDRLACFLPTQKATPRAWREHLEALAGEWNFWAGGEERDLMLSAQDLFQDFLISLDIIDEAHAMSISGLVFWDIVDRHLLAGDIRGTGEPLAGVQILSIPEARTMPFTRAILIGCQEGYFPQALPQDEVLDNYLKKAMGLPGWEALEAMEDQTFHLLEARLPQLILLRAQNRGGEPVLRSRFTEALIATEGLQEIDLPAWAFAYPRPRANQLILRDDPEGQIPGDPELLWSSMSASRVENLLRCPYAFLMHKLQVSALRPAPWAGDARREGEWLHAVLEAFITGQSRKRQVLEPWPLHSRAEDFRRIALERLNTLTHSLAPAELQNAPIIQHLIRHAWPQFVLHLESLGAEQISLSRASQREVKFGEGSPRAASVKLGDRLRLLVGRIDALDEFGELLLITDYKRRRSPSIEASLRGLAPQLAFYSLALRCSDENFSQKPVLLGYWNIYQGSWQTHAISHPARAHTQAKGLSSSRTPELNAIETGLLNNWLWREDEVRRQGRFFADPSVCELCSFDAICRKEDPRFRARIQQQKAWEQRIKASPSQAEENPDAGE